MDTSSQLCTTPSGTERAWSLTDRCLRRNDDSSGNGSALPRGTVAELDISSQLCSTPGREDRASRKALDVGRRYGRESAQLFAASANR